MKALRIIFVLLLLSAFCPESFAQDTSDELKAAFERCIRISDEISEIRKLKFKNKVQVKLQTRKQFVEYIEKEIKEQYGTEDEIESYIDALVLLGALKEKVEFADTLKEMMISQAAAHYDPRNNIYYLLMGDSPPLLLDIVSSHELCHALQDQHFDLTKLIMDDPVAMRDNGDAAMAKQCMAEGDATIVMIWWAMANQMPKAAPAQMSAQVSLAIGIQASMDFDMMKDLMRQGVADSGMALGSIADSVEDLENFPRYFMEALIMAYIQGSVAVDRVRTEGGWKAVNELFANPPTSTEQILHPEKLIGERDEPVEVRLKKLVSSPPEGWKIAEEDVLGELGTRILFSTWNDDSATNKVKPAIAASGWGGDRYYYLTRDNEEMLVWKSVWDTEKDARKFASALLLNLRTRYADLKETDSKLNEVTISSNDERKLLIYISKKEVGLINAPKQYSAGKLLQILQ